MENPSVHSRLTRQIALAALALALFCALAGSMSAQTPTPVTVPTWRYDLTHAGENTQETALTPANVNVNSFGKLFGLTVDGNVYAQPLYVPGLKMSDGNVHNVLFVATENDSIYAFDADSNGGANSKPIWQISLLNAAHGATAGATPQAPKSTGENDIGPVIGITGTPVINPATNTMYVVGATEEKGTYFIRLHAINILTGAERANSPVAAKATVTGTGNGSSGGKLSFSPLWENQRSALNYYNGYVYVGFAAHGDLGPWHGWLLAYNGTTLAQTAVVCLSPNGVGSGIWASGAGMPIDDDATGGRMFVVTGNGTHTTYPKFPYSGSLGMGESVIDFNLANGGLTTTDEFTSFNYSKLNTSDLDLGSGGILMVPDQQGDDPHILVQAGKEGRIVVLNRDNLGGYAPGGTSNTNALQDISGQIGGLWSTPAYWNGNVYIWAAKDVAKAFKLSDGVLGSEPFSQASVTSGFPGASFTVSSNGTQDGIAWAVRSDQVKTNGPNVLYAWDANDLTNTIYESDTNAKRDAGGIANRFTIPVVTNGKVYVSGNKQVAVYGLLNGEPTAAAPLISPDGGTFSSSQSVTLSSTTASAEIHYTLNGATPTSSSALYNGAITIATTTTVKAIASATGYVQSGVSSAAFTFGTSGSCSAPTSAGVHLCVPASGSTVSSPVMVQATAKVTGTIASTQLWVDGVKKYSTASSSLNTSISLAAGSHRFAVIASNTAGQKWESAVNATVQ
ncbi:MAG TPA: chitobiase/beta-hexosaminidase C-terminal domain-containing protein [Acidobacteriaceae bacterium]